MVHPFGGRSLWVTALLIVILVLTLSIPCSNSLRITKTNSMVFRSPKFKLEPGLVVSKIYYNIDFPSPLRETYMHHWVVFRYYQRKHGSFNQRNQSIYMPARNHGVCQKDVLGQYFGLGSETRKTPLSIPDPYGIEVGYPTEIPDGFEERWYLKVHAIDVRGVEDRLRCTECRCDLYNITKDQLGRPLRPDYKGGVIVAIIKHIAE